MKNECGSRIELDTKGISFVLVQCKQLGEINYELILVSLALNEVITWRQKIVYVRFFNLCMKCFKT
jgi:hypothetical protein